MWRRRSFFVLGVPGIVLAVMVRTMIAEPERGRLDAEPPGVKQAGFGDVLRYSAASPALAVRWR